MDGKKKIVQIMQYIIMRSSASILVSGLLCNICVPIRDIFIYINVSKSKITDCNLRHFIFNGFKSLW